MRLYIFVAFSSQRSICNVLCAKIDLKFKLSHYFLKQENLGGRDKKKNEYNPKDDIIYILLCPVLTFIGNWG